MNPGLRERLGGLLQTTVLQICQRIVPFSHDVAIVGNLSIQADSKEICKVTFSERAAEKVNGMGSYPQKDKETDELFRRSIEAINSLNDSESSPSVKSSLNVNQTPTSQSNMGFKTPSPRAGELATMKNLTGSRQSLVDTLVKEAMKVWYNEGPSPDRVRCQEIRAEFAQDSQKTAAVELGIEAINRYGEISPETLEAAAQLRRLGEQPQFLVNKPPTGIFTSPPADSPSATFQKPLQQPQLPPPPQTTIECTPLASRPKHARKQKLIVNPDYETPRKGTKKPTSQFQTPLKNSKGMYECETCGKEFTFGTNLTRHQRNFHGRPFTRKGKDCKRQKRETKQGAGESQSIVDSSSSCHSGVEEEDEDDYMEEEHTENNANLANQNLNLNVQVNQKHLDENRNVDLCNTVVNSQQSVALSNVPYDNGITLQNGNYAVSSCNHMEMTDHTEENCDSSSVHSDSTDVTTGTYASGQKYVYMSITDTSSEAKYACKICNRKFPHYRNLGRHLKVSHNVSIIDLEMEDSSTNHSVQANADDLGKGKHIAPDKHVCKLCGHSFSFANNLYRHISKAHRSPKQQPGKTIKKAIRKGSCSSVSDDDSSEGSRSRHTCEMCQKSFTKASNLARHYRKVHKVVKVAIQSKGSTVQINAEPVNEAGSNTQQTVGSKFTGPEKNTLRGLSDTGAFPQGPADPAVAPVHSQPPVSGPRAPAQMFTPQQLQMSSQLSPLLHPATFPPFLAPHSTTDSLATNHFSRSPGIGMLPHSQYSQLMTPDPLGRGLRFPGQPPHGMHSQLPNHQQYCAPDMMSPVSSDISPNTSHSSDNTSPSQQQQQQHISAQQISVAQDKHIIQGQANMTTALTNPVPSLPGTQYIPSCHESPPDPSQEASHPAEKSQHEENEARPFVCSTCAMTFSYRTNLVRHMKTVHKVHSLEADQSDKASTKAVTPKKQRPLKPAAPITSVALKIPIVPSSLTAKATTPKNKSKSSRAAKAKESPTSPRHRHTCPVCSWSFTFRTNLTRHMKKQHNQVPNFEDAENKSEKVLS